MHGVHHTVPESTRGDTILDVSFRILNILECLIINNLGLDACDFSSSIFSQLTDSVSETSGVWKFDIYLNNENNHVKLWQV